MPDPSLSPELDWQACYAVGDTPWDKGEAAPPLVDYLKVQPFRGRLLVPGCGRGHDVRALAQQPGTTVLGLDLSATAVEQAGQAQHDFVAQGKAAFRRGDFLQLPSDLEQAFDGLFEHTCFCAVHPSQRAAYFPAAHRALRPGGRILGIFYLDPQVEQGPPFGITEPELHAYFDPCFEVERKWIPARTFPGREGGELVLLLKTKASAQPHTSL